MRVAARLFVVAALLAAVNAAASCSKKLGPSDIPIVATDTFTGTITPGGMSSHTFTVRYAVGYTDASATVTSLTSAANSTVPAITIGIAFGNISEGVCTRAPSYTNPRAVVNQEQPTGDAPFIAGSFCVQVFDNPAAPTVTEPLNYSLRVLHY